MLAVQGDAAEWLRSGEDAWHVNSCGRDESTKYEVEVLCAKNTVNLSQNKMLTAHWHAHIMRASSYVTLH